jgi:hypothetical protein
LADLIDEYFFVDAHPNTSNIKLKSTQLNRWRATPTGVLCNDSGAS